jgi:hypothetical protein
MTYTPLDPSDAVVLFADLHRRAEIPRTAAER